ncbi:MAG: RNA methyltransferase, partial [Oscillibacter sp.]|nr:RNA methyltransferase [Oscillibacter sp.]
MERITSRQNPLCKHIRALAASASYRAERGEYLCESPKLLAEALKNGAEVRAVIVSEGTEVAQREGVRTACVPEDVMRSLSPMASPQGVLFTCALPRPSLPARLTGRRYVVLDTVQDPGNVGTILRTADA